LRTKELLNDIVEYLKLKHSIQGIATADQIDGCFMSAVGFALQNKPKPKVFNIILYETQGKNVNKAE